VTDRIPDPADPFEEEGLAPQEPGLPGKLITGDAQDQMVVPRDEPLAVDDYGTTAAEEQQGEPLDVRLNREQPDLSADGEADYSDEAADPYPVDRDERAGRIVEPDEGGGPDVTAETVGIDVGTDSGGFTAEERAMRIEPDPET
jgi:hypothetical protein